MQLLGEGEGVRLLSQTLESVPERVVEVGAHHYLFAGDAVSAEFERDRADVRGVGERHPHAPAEIGCLPAGQPLHFADISLEEEQDHRVSIRGADGWQLETLCAGQVIYLNLPAGPWGCRRDPDAHAVFAGGLETPRLRVCVVQHRAVREVAEVVRKEQLILGERYGLVGIKVLGKCDECSA
jgi:hypothetical protein